MKRNIRLSIAVTLVTFSGMLAFNANAQTSVKKALVPTVTIPAPPGSKGFGMPQPAKPGATTPPPMIPRVSASVTEPREITTKTLDDLSMSDPYILADDATKTYYLTSSGGCIYKSTDLKNWTGPFSAYDTRGTWMEGINFVAAAEIHKVNGKYYYAATFGDRKELVDVVPRRYNIYRHQTMILESDKAEGPFKLKNPDPNYDYLPHSWDIIDGTIYVENGQPYMVFVHEWMQTFDGTIEYVKLSPDLTKTISEPVMLFRATESPCPLEMVGNGEMTYGLKIPGWVTDGPQLFRTKTGKLGMLWASWGAKRYLECVAYSQSGTIDGPWIQEEKPFIDDNTGHGMLFRTFDGKLLLSIHHAEGDGPRKPQLWEVDDSGDKLVLGKRFNP
jgi:beta-xylosidase